MTEPRCDDCGRPRMVLVVSGTGRFCGSCIDWSIAARMKAARDEAKRTSGNSYRASARNAEQADEKIGERTK